MISPGQNYPEFSGPAVYQGAEFNIESSNYLRKTKLLGRHVKHQKLIKKQFRGFQGGYLVLIFYPANFTLTAQQNLLTLSDNIEDFFARETKILACSQETCASTLYWINTPRSNGGIANIRFPVLCDRLGTICRAFHVLQGSNSDTEDSSAGISLQNNDSLVQPTLFILDPLGKVRYVSMFQDPIQLCLQEILRILDCLIEVDSKGDQGLSELRGQYSGVPSRGNTTRTNTIMTHFDSPDNLPAEETTEDGSTLYENNGAQTCQSKSFVNTSTQANILNINDHTISLANQCTQTIICHDCSSKSLLLTDDIETNRARTARNPPTEMSPKTAITTEEATTPAAAEAFKAEGKSLERQCTTARTTLNGTKITIAVHDSKDQDAEEEVWSECRQTDATSVLPSEGNTPESGQHSSDGQSSPPATEVIPCPIEPERHLAAESRTDDEKLAMAAALPPHQLERLKPAVPVRARSLERLQAPDNQKTRLKSSLARSESMRPVARPRVKSKPDEQQQQTQQQQQQQQQAKQQPQQHRQQQQPTTSTTRSKSTKPQTKSSTNSCQTQ